MILKWKLCGTFYALASQSLMEGNLSPSISSFTLFNFLLNIFNIFNIFKSIYLKFHPFQLPREHLQPLFCSNRKLKLGEPTSKHDLKPDITHLLYTNNMCLTALYNSKSLIPPTNTGHQLKFSTKEVNHVAAQDPIGWGIPQCFGWPTIPSSSI